MSRHSVVNITPPRELMRLVESRYGLATYALQVGDSGISHALDGKSPPI